MPKKCLGKHVERQILSESYTDLTMRVLFPRSMSWLPSMEFSMVDYECNRIKRLNPIEFPINASKNRNKQKARRKSKLILKYTFFEIRIKLEKVKIEIENKKKVKTKNKS